MRSLAGVADGSGIPEFRGGDDTMDAAVIQNALPDRDQEFVPFELAKHTPYGEHPARVWREHRGMCTAGLAAVAGIAAAYLPDIEDGSKPVPAKAVEGGANALGAGVEHLSRFVAVHDRIVQVVRAADLSRLFPDATHGRRCRGAEAVEPLVGARMAAPESP